MWAVLGNGPDLPSAAAGSDTAIVDPSAGTATLRVHYVLLIGFESFVMSVRLDYGTMPSQLCEADLVVNT